MKRLLSWGLALVAFFVLSGSSAYAQYGTYSPRPGPTGPTVGPPVSPYLNLMPNAATNFYLQTVPQLNRPTLDSALETQIRNVQRSTPDVVNAEVVGLLRALNISEPLEGTGHVVRFGDTAPYFRTRMGAGQPGAGYGAGSGAGLGQGTIPGR